MIQQQINTKNTNNQQQSFKVVLVGDAGVGKTHLMTRYVKGWVPLKTIPTVGIEFAAKTVTLSNGDEVQAQIWDTSGDQLYRGIICSHFRNAVGALVVYDVTKGSTFESVLEWVENLKQIAEPNAFIILVGNKIDLVENNESARKVEKDVVQNLAQWLGVQCEEVSAKTGYNVAQCFDQLFQGVIFQMCNKQSQATVQSTVELTKTKPQQQIITCSQCQEQYQDFIEHNCIKQQNPLINQQQEMIQQFSQMHLEANQNFNQIEGSQQISQIQNIYRKCKNGHQLNWCSKYSIPCSLCFLNQETIRYQCLQCKYFVCQKCLSPYFVNQKCPSQHILVYIQRPNNGMFCDFCSKSPYQEGWPVWSDRQCDFDVCQPCYMKCQQ